MKALFAIDACLAWLLQWPLRILCGLTGWRKITIAIAVEALGFMFLAQDLIFQPQSSPIILQILVVAVGVAICSAVFVSCVRILLVAAQSHMPSRDASSTIDFRGLVLRVTYMLLGIAVGRIDWEFLLIGAAFYFAIDDRTPETSWSAGSVSRAKSALNNIRVPSGRPVALPRGI